MSSVRTALLNDGRAAAQSRLSAVPSRYLSVSRPWASAVNAMAPMPFSASASVRPPSIQRLSSEYDGWSMTNGVPSLCAIAAASRVRSAEYDDTPTYRAFPLSHYGVQRSDRLFQRSVGIETVRIEDVYIVQGQPRQRRIETGEQVLARPQVSIRTRPHVPARFGGDDQLIAIGAEVPCA